MNANSANQTDPNDETEAEKAMAEKMEQTAREMKDTMNTMMLHGTRMMEAFIDMRMSYLTLAQHMVKDPATAFGYMAKNLEDLKAAVEKADADKAAAARKASGE